MGMVFHSEPRVARLRRASCIRTNRYSGWLLAADATVRMPDGGQRARFYSFVAKEVIKKFLNI
jgi:hypothetical protein